MTAQELKESLSVDEVKEVVETLGATRFLDNQYNAGFITNTICHNPDGDGSLKLYYYADTFSFHCYTECSCNYDIFSLVCKIKNWELKELPRAMNYVLDALGRESLSYVKPEEDHSLQIKQPIINSINKHKLKKDFKLEPNLPYDKKILDFFTFDIHQLERWRKENISYQTMKEFKIGYYPYKHQIIIPHFDILGQLVGVKCRNLENIELEHGRKYIPLQIENREYNHKISQNLYGIHLNFREIIMTKKVYLVESEKSVLKAYSVGIKNVVACCGSFISTYQIRLLQSLGIREVVLCLDKEFQKKDSLAYASYLNKMNETALRFGRVINTSFIDYPEDKVTYKDCIFDATKEIDSLLYYHKKEIAI